jgi:hypothetical protein
MDGGKVIGAASQKGSPYQFTVSKLEVGIHTLTASYSGDARSAGSSSNAITITVLP